jgi:post-segregation antitoxin (ccd killing protein)
MTKMRTDCAVSQATVATSTAAIGQDLISLQRQDSKPVSAMVYKPIASECKVSAIQKWLS